MYHFYEAKEHVTVKKLQLQAPSSNNWKQKHHFVSRHWKLLQSIEFWHRAYLLGMVVADSLLCFHFVQCFSLFLKSMACNCCKLCCFMESAYIDNAAAPCCRILVDAMEADSTKIFSNWWFFNCGQFNQDYKILLGLKDTLSPRQMQQVYERKSRSKNKHK